MPQEDKISKKNKLYQQYDEVIQKYYKHTDKGSLSAVHGTRHLANTHFFAKTWLKLYKKYFPQKFENISLEQEEHILLALLFHDSGRVADGIDDDQLSSALLFLSYALECSMEPQTAIDLACAMTLKDGNEVCYQELKNLLTSSSELNKQSIQNLSIKYISNGNKKIQKLNSLLNFKVLNDIRVDSNVVVNKDAKIIKDNLARIIIHEADYLDIMRTRDKFDDQQLCVIKSFSVLSAEKRAIINNTINLFTAFSKDEQKITIANDTFEDYLKHCESKLLDKIKSDIKNTIIPKESSFENQIVVKLLSEISGNPTSDAVHVLTLFPYSQDKEQALNGKIAGLKSNAGDEKLGEEELERHIQDAKNIFYNDNIEDESITQFIANQDKKYVEDIFQADKIPNAEEAQKIFFALQKVYFYREKQKVIEEYEANLADISAYKDMEINAKKQYQKNIIDIIRSKVPNWNSKQTDDEAIKDAIKKETLTDLQANSDETFKENALSLKKIMLFEDNLNIIQLYSQNPHSISEYKNCDKTAQNEFYKKLLNQFRPHLFEYFKIKYNNAVKNMVKNLHTDKMIKLTTSSLTGTSGHAYLLYQEGDILHLINSMQKKEESDNDRFVKSIISSVANTMNLKINYAYKNKQNFDIGCIFCAYYSELLLKNGTKVQDLPDIMDLNKEKTLIQYTYEAFRPNYADIEQKEPAESMLGRVNDSTIENKFKIKPDIEAKLKEALTVPEKNQEKQNNQPPAPKEKQKTLEVLQRHKDILITQQDIILNDINNNSVKQNHWMWYGFPQTCIDRETGQYFQGASEASKRYALTEDEAVDYLKDTDLRKMLLDRLVAIREKNITKFFFGIDQKKLHSSLDLFWDAAVKINDTEIRNSITLIELFNSLNNANKTDSLNPKASSKCQKSDKNDDCYKVNTNVAIHSEAKLYQIQDYKKSAIRIKSTQDKQHEEIIKEMSEILKVAIIKTKNQYPNEEDYFTNAIYATDVINFAIEKGGVGNIDFEEWSSFSNTQRGTSEQITVQEKQTEFKIAKELSRQYQIAAKKRQFFTGRTERLKKELVGQRLCRIPEKYVAEIIAKALEEEQAKEI